MAKIKDNANGFWIEFIKRKGSTELFLRQNVVPDSRLMRIVGQEAISSIKGSIKHKITFKYYYGKLLLNRLSNGSYSFGITKRISPNGQPYQKLDETTLKQRILKSYIGEFEVARNKNFILRETSSHIMRGLKIKSSMQTRKASGIVIGYPDVENEKIANLQNKGGRVSTRWLFASEFDRDLILNKMKTSEIPARPFIGFQKEFIDNYFSMMKDLF
jgi:hypothetical protein